MTQAHGEAGEDAGGPLPWVVAVDVEPALELPEIGPDDAPALCEWLWLRFGDAGLVGIDEGSIAVADAAAAGLVETPLVIDAAEAPPDRDWVAAAGPTRLALAFADESACRAAVAALGGVVGLAVGVPRAACPGPTEPQAAVAVEGFGWILPPEGALPAAASAGAAAPATIVFLDAGLGFGTGLHPTTRLCLREVAAHAAAGGRLARVLDCGAGSGILGIAAATLGAAQVDAVEIDARVHAAIRRNAALNGVAARVRVVELPGAGDAVRSGAPPYDLVLANIVAGVLLELSGALTSRVAAGGRLVLSGLLAGEVPGVAAHFAVLLGAEPRIERDQGWHCLVFSPRARAAT